MNSRTDFWHERRVLVTGCTGLAGSWLIRSLLERGAAVVGLVRDQTPYSELVSSGNLERIEVVQGRVEHFSLLERILSQYQINTVFHLAAQTSSAAARRNPLATFEANLQGTWCLLEACRRSCLRPQVCITLRETTAETEGQDILATSQVCVESLARSYAATFQLPVGLARCGRLFGGGDLRWERLVPATVRAIWRGRRPALPPHAETVRYNLYVKDLANALVQLAETLDHQPELAGQVFHFATDPPLSDAELVRMVVRLMDPSSQPDKPAGTPTLVDQVPPRRLLTGWAPTYTLREALSETILWYRVHFTLQGEELGQKRTETRRRRAA